MKNGLVALDLGLFELSTPCEFASSLLFPVIADFVIESFGTIEKYVHKKFETLLLIFEKFIFVRRKWILKVQNELKEKNIYKVKNLWMESNAHLILIFIGRTDAYLENLQILSNSQSKIFLKIIFKEINFKILFHDLKFRNLNMFSKIS